MSIFAFTGEEESDCLQTLGKERKVYMLAEKEGADKEGRLSMLSYK
jgi:hypothetical protein